MSRPAATVALLRASHFPPTVAVTAIATALAVSVGRGAGSVAVGSAVASGQLAVGWSNDYIDRDRDRSAGRIDKPIAAGQIDAATVRGAATVALVACVPLSLLSGWRGGLLHLAAVGAALAYNIRLKATVWSPLPFAVAFAILPMFVTLGLAGHPWPPAWAVGAAASMGCGAHFINTLGDMRDDVDLGILGMPQRIGVQASLGVGALLLAFAVVLLTFAPPGGPTGAVLVSFVASMVLVVGVVVSARFGSLRIAWPLTLLTALVAVVLLLANGTSLT